MKTYRLLVSGLVQGIGFRPFTAELAESLGLSGKVKNLGGMVELILAGEEEQIEQFICSLRSAEKFRILSGCRIDEWKLEEIELPFMEKGFFIEESGTGQEIRRFLPTDLAVCDRCIAEMHDKKNHRYRYPFISCTSCGPRFSIQKKVPYDREMITMDDFPMCEFCRQEYEEKGNIRRHAQTIACKNCGPKLNYVAKDFLQISDDRQAISQVVQALKNDKIGAIKDIGGYHFACSPFSSRAAGSLREFKNRDKKPFAVMFQDLRQVRKYCEVSEKEAAILTSSVRPIVLLKKREKPEAEEFVSEICGESDRIGAILPCNPLQILIIEQTGPLVMTSGNRGGEPIIISEEVMQQYIGNGIDFMLTHNREILTPLDDSIYQVADAKIQIIRRARGLVPEPITLKRCLSEDVFAAGGDLKAVFGLGRGNLVYLSQHFGDLEDASCMESRQKAKTRMMDLFEIYPKRSIGDLHPLYISGKGTEEKVQHHHAHIASVIAEHGLEGKVLGIACDGTGYGTDGTIWGSEFLLCEEKKVKRMGHFSPVRLLGGDAGAKDADMTLYSYVLEAGARGYQTQGILEEYYHSCETETKKQGIYLQKMAWEQNINTAYSSSMGRLFDAAAALLDISHVNSYEGECAILLEQAAHRGKIEISYACKSGKGPDADKIINVVYEKKEDRLLLDGVRFLMDLYALKNSYSKEVLAYLFHHAIARGMTEMAEQICKDEDITQIALSGGTFYNRILLNEMVSLLEKRQKDVYWNEKVPCGDGGIALGQMYLATFL